MRWLARSFGPAAIAWVMFCREACAHALAQRYDLPLPLGLFLAGAGAVVAVSFVIIALFWRRKSKSYPDYAIALGHVPTWIAAACQIAGVGALALIVVAGLFGHPSTFKNIAPVAVWVIWWVGLSFVSAFVGNVWALINPWSAAFGFFEWLARRWSRQLSLHRPYPAWLGCWPACAIFLVFAWLELIAPGRDVPRNVAIAILIYSGITWTGFVVFGREVWLKSGEAFSIAFGLFSRFAPLHLSKNQRWHCTLRPYATGLLAHKPLAPSMIAFTLLMLGTVTADGIMETPLWAAGVDQFVMKPAGMGPDAAMSMLLGSLLLIVWPLLLGALYLGVIAIMARMTRSRIAALAGWFVLPLVPIAIAYHLSHYFSLLMLAGQFIIPLASDPFGYGWDLFGTRLYRIDIGIVDAKLIWYLAVSAIVTGHVIAVWLGHATAFDVFSNGALARRSQFPMLILMVGYTMLSLWIIAQPIVEPGK